MRNILMKYTALALALLLALLLCAAGALADAPLTDEWQGVPVTPMYYYYCNFPNYGVRVSCGEVPMAWLYGHMGEIQLLREDGSVEAAGYRISVMGETLDGTEGDRTTEFFDVVFQVEDDPGEDGMTIRFGDAGQPLRVPVSEGNPDRCWFRTGSGDWVVHFWNRMQPGDAAELAKAIAGEMKGQDITLWLDDYYSDVNADDFLSLVGPASVRLVTALEIRSADSFDPGIITELTEKGFFRPSYPILPNVKKLTLFRNAIFPRTSLAAAFPALEELDLVIRLDDPDARFTDSGDRTQNVCPTLKILNCTVNGKAELPKDPGFRAWLAAQLAAAPEMTVNGADAASLDPAEGLEGEDLERVARARDDMRLRNFLDLCAGKNVKKGKIPSGGVVVAAFDRTGDLLFSSTDAEPGYDLSGIPAERLAAGLSGAEAAVIIYPVMKVTGRYTNGFDAESTETRIALVDLASGKVIRDQSVVKRKPPSTMTVSGAKISSTSGEFEVQMGIDAAAKLLKGK